jgi:hypothetical protein
VPTITLVALPMASGVAFSPDKITHGCVHCSFAIAVSLVPAAIEIRQKRTRP